MCVQETHIVGRRITRVQDQWEKSTGGTSYWNPGPSSRSGGTGILLLNKSIRVKAIQKDSTGRILCLDLNHEGGNFQIMTIYGPNSPGDREFFFDTLQDHAFTTKTMILCGDFNMVENPKLDRQPPVDGSNYTEGNVNLQSFLTSHDLSDQWRRENPSKKMYTWANPSEGVSLRSRIDRFYASSNLTLTRQAHRNDPNIRSDHSLVMAHFIMPVKVERGPGYWKLNTSVLQNFHYVDTLTAVMEADTDKADIGLWWERLKVRVKVTTIEYLRRKNILTSNALTNLRTKLEAATVPLEIQDLTEKIHDIDMRSKDGVMIRSREKDIVNEDRPTKYFYIQENHRQTKSTISEVRVPDGRGGMKTYTKRHEILKCLHEHYSQLYRERGVDPHYRDLFANQVSSQLTDQQKAWLDREITLKELEDAINAMAVNRSPGPDGLPVEFYDRFFHVIGRDLLRLYNEIFSDERGESPSQKMGYIKLVPKKGEKFFLDNWRGITLLNLDHKILTKIMATRLQKLFPDIIHEDQVCTVPGRNIFDHAYLVRDVIDHAVHHKTPLYVVSWDMKQAFDSVDYDYAFKVLQNFNIGNKFLGLIRSIYSDRRLQVMNNGYFTHSITRTR